jgi:peptide/nickel transport system substrate-binding protein/oligopeptide transport system substrate-binding protein
MKAPPSQQVYRVPAGQIQTLDPAIAGDVSSIQAVEMVFTGLVQLDDQLNLRPQLAQSWDVGPDGLTWTFHLKPNLKFSDGTPLTSNDVAYSIDRALQPSTNSQTSVTFLSLIKDYDALHSGQIGTIIDDSIFTPDDNTIVIVTSKKAPYFLSALAVQSSFVVEKKLIDKYGKHFTNHLNEGGGAGPFIVSKYNPNHGIDFVPNANYYDPKPQLQKVIFSFYQYDENIYKGYQIGQLDMIPVPPNLKELEAARNTPGFHQIFKLTIYYNAMNYLVKPFDNIHIRQAFALAINRKTINSKIWLNLRIPTYHIIPQGMPGYNEYLTGPAGVTDPAGDPKLAKDLLLKGLHEEGWSSISQVPPIKLTYSGYPHSPEIDAVIGMWQSVLGIFVEADPVADYNTFINQVNAARNNPYGLQLWEDGWSADYVDPHNWTTQFFDKDSPENNVNYGQNNSTVAVQQQSVQKLLEAADINSNHDSRFTMYRQAEQQLVNDVAWMPMFQDTSTFLLKPYVRGIIVSNPSELTPPDDWATIYIAAH